MPVQTAYANIDAAFEGLIADMNPQEVVTKIAEGDVAFGRAVVRGTADDQAILPSATGQALVGVTAYTLGAYAHDTEDIYADTEEMNVVRSGYVWVITEQAVVPGDSVFFRHTAGAGGTVIGAFRKDVDTASADQIVGATYETTSGAGELALIRKPY